MLYVTLLIFIIITLFNYKISGNRITYPPFIFCFIWLLTLSVRVLISNFFLEDLFEIRANTCLLVIAGGIVATIAGYISLSQFTLIHNSRGLKPDIEANSIVFSGLSKNLRLFLTLSCVVAFPLFINYIRTVIIPGQVENIFKSIRYETGIKQVSFGVFGYFVSFSAFVSLLNGFVFWQNKSLFNRWIYIVSIIVALVFAITTMGRSPVLMTLSFNAALYLISSSKVKIRNLIKFSLGFILIFLVMGVLLDKGGSTDNTFNENAKHSIEDFGIYLLTPLNALDYLMNVPLDKKDEGKRSMRFFYVLGMKAGIVNINDSELDLVDDFIFIPYPVNVYTFYNPYYRDFGIVYSLLFLFAVILWHSGLYIKSILLPFTYFSRIFYCLLFFPLIMVFFNDQYMSLLSTWIQLFGYSILVYLLFVFARVFRIFFSFQPSAHR